MCNYRKLITDADAAMHSDVRRITAITIKLIIFLIGHPKALFFPSYGSFRQLFSLFINEWYVSTVFSYILYCEKPLKLPLTMCLHPNVFYSLHIYCMMYCFYMNSWIITQVEKVNIPGVAHTTFSVQFTPALTHRHRIWDLEVMSYLKVIPWVCIWQRERESIGNQVGWLC